MKLSAWIVDDDATTMATEKIAILRGADWIDPFGGTFDDAEQREIHAFARGEGVWRRHPMARVCVAVTR